MRLQSPGVVEEALVTSQASDYAEKELALPENVKVVPELMGEMDQEPVAAVELVSWLPGEAGHDEVLTWAWKMDSDSVGEL